MKTVAERIALGIILALIAVAAFVGISAYRVRRQATILLNEFRELGLSTNPTDSFERLKRKYTAQMHERQGCTPHQCQYEMTFSNKTLSLLRVVPHTEMKLYLTTYDGTLRWEMLDYRVALTGRKSPIVHIEQGSCMKGCGTRFDVNPHGTSGQVWNGLVNYDQRATAQQRNAALALNLNCLVRPGGCNDIVDLLPTMWGHEGPGTIKSRVVGLSQELEESHRFLSPDD